MSRPRKRRPSVRDRDFVDYIERLPEGEHVFHIEGLHSWNLAPLKCEGGMITTLDNGRRLTVIPDFSKIRK